MMRTDSLSTTRYTPTAVMLHWLIGIALIGEIAFGFLLREIPRGTLPRGMWVNLHKSTGIVLGLLIVWRIVWRFTHRPPAVPLGTPEWQAAASRMNHGVMYVCMLVIPLAGYLASNFSKHGVKFFSIAILLPWGPDDPRLYALLNGIHNWTAYALTALITLHVLATLKHVLIDRDRLLSRMAPRQH